MDKLTLVKKFYEVMWNRSDLDIADEIIHPDYHPSDVQMPENGPALIKKEIIYFRSIFPDLFYEIIDHSVSENRVWIRYRGTATQKGEGWGFKATNKKIEFEGAAIFTVENDMIIDAWRNYCLYRIFADLGHIPPLWEIAKKLDI